MLTVKGKALGRRRPLFEDFSTPPPEELADGGNTTLRELIEFIVRREVEAFRERQQQRRFVQALTARDIEAGVEAGKVAGGGDVEPQEVDEEQAVATAWQAFEDGMFLVVIDEQDQRRLDAEVYLRPDSQLTFVRLTLLAGG